MPYEFYFLKGLALTLSCEVFAGVICRLGAGKFFFLKGFQNIGWPKFLIGIVMASMLTLPYVWFVLYLIRPEYLFILIAEVFAWSMETVFYKYFFEVSFLQAMIFSLLLNLFSFGLGLVVFPLL